MAKDTQIKEEVIKEQGTGQDKPVSEVKQEPTKEAEQPQPAPEPKAESVEHPAPAKESNPVENELAAAVEQEPERNAEPVAKAEPEKPAAQEEPPEQPEPDGGIVEKPVAQAEIENSDGEKQPEPEGEPVPVTVATQVDVEDLAQPAGEQPLDVFEEVESGDGEVSDPSKKLESNADEPDISLNPIDEKPVASDDPDAGNPVKPAPEGSEALESGDGDVSDPSKTGGDADGTEPEKVIPGSVDLQDSGDGDVSDPSSKADTGEPINAIPEIDSQIESGDGDVTDPVEPAVPFVDLVSSGDADAGDPVKPAPDNKTDAVSSGDADAGDPVKPAPDLAKVNDDDGEPNEAAPEPVVSPIDGQNVAVADLDRIDIDTEQVAEIPEQLAASIVESGQVDAVKARQLLGDAQIKPDDNSQVSSNLIKPVEVESTKNGGFSVTKHEIDRTTIKVYDADGNLVLQQNDTANGTTIIEHGPDSTKVTMIFDTGELIEAVQNDDGSGTLEITNPDGSTDSVTITPPPSSSDDESGNASSGSDTDGQGGSNASSDDSDDSDDDGSDLPDGDEDDDSDLPDGDEDENESGSKDGEGTPNPIDDGGDGPPLVFVTDGQLGRQDQSNTERGIETQAGAGHTDPVDHEEAEATLEFLTSELGQDQMKDNEKAVENAAGGGHTDPAEDDGDSIDVLTDRDLEHIEFLLAGGGVTDPVDDVLEGGQDEATDASAGAAIQDSVQTAQQEFAAVADSAASLIDALDLNIEVNVEDLDDEF